jgi:hypothetical protein
MGTLRPVTDEWVRTSSAVTYRSQDISLGPDTQAKDTRTLPTARRKKKVPVEFDREDDDTPILEDPSQMMARVMEPMVRQFLSIHYSTSIEIRPDLCYIYPF